MGRGADQSDVKTFAEKHLRAMNQAVSDLSWLLGRGYSAVAALKLVGDHHQLTKRQRKALIRCACSDQNLAAREANRVDSIAGRHVAIDAFNQLIGLERAIAGGPLLLGRDGVLRDIAGVHGSYKTVSQTPQAVHVIQDALKQALSVTWLIDRPVSNSGKLAHLLRELAPDGRWTAEVVDSPDHVLKVGEAIAISGDGPILERCTVWFNLLPTILPASAWVVHLGGKPPDALK